MTSLFFTLQLVWYNSYQVGCAVAYCPRNQYNYFYVCHYCPPYVLLLVLLRRVGSRHGFRNSCSLLSIGRIRCLQFALAIWNFENADVNSCFNIKLNINV